MKDIMIIIIIGLVNFPFNFTNRNSTLFSVSFLLYLVKGADKPDLKLANDYNEFFVHELKVGIFYLSEHPCREQLLLSYSLSPSYFCMEN